MMPWWAKLVIICVTLIGGFSLSFAVALALRYTDDEDLVEVDDYEDFLEGSEEK